jgi:hypothetical protein
VTRDGGYKSENADKDHVGGFMDRVGGFWRTRKFPIPVTRQISLLRTKKKSISIRKPGFDTVESG